MEYVRSDLKPHETFQFHRTEVIFGVLGASFIAARASIDFYSYLELHELGNVEAEGEEGDDDDVEEGRRPPDADPERLADGEVALEGDGERREDGAHLGDVRQAVEEGQRARVHVLHPRRRQGDRFRCNAR